MSKSHHQYLVIYTAGTGDQRRWNRMALDFFDAVKRVTGSIPVSLMGGITRDSLVLGISCELDAQALYAAIKNSLPDGSFFFGGDNPDRLLIVETTGRATASDAVVETAMSLR